MRRIAPGIIMLALGLAACGGSHKSSTQATVASVPTVTTTRTIIRTTGTTTAHTTPTSAGPQPCRASTLALRFLGQQGAAGHGEIGFAFRNTGSATCHTVGFPGILFLDRSGRPLPTASQHVTTDMAGKTPVTSLNVAPGGSVSFRLFVTHGAVPGLPCTTAYGLQVIPPNDTASLRVTIPDGGAFECKDATVTPLQPGNSAYMG